MAEPWSLLSGVLNSGQVIPYEDTGISRVSEGVLAVGNGTLRDASGTLAAANIKAGTVTFSDGSVQTTAIFKQVTVTLTSAQLLALSTTPITLIPAPAAGFYICPSYYYMQYHFGGTAYAGSGSCDFIYGPPPVVNPTNLLATYNWTAATSGIVKAAASCTFIGIFGEGLTPYTTVSGAAMVFTAPTAITGGNGTLTITVNYSIQPLP